MAGKSGSFNGWKLFFRSLFFFVFSVAFLAFSAWMFDPALNYYTSPSLDVSDKAHYWTVDRYEEGNIEKPTDIMLSVVIPAYNEELRLPSMLDETIEYLNEWTSFHDIKYEIVLVSDGSVDGTDEVAMKYVDAHFDNFRYLKLIKNQGKGAAIKVGVENALGRYVLFADADGATDIKDLDKLFQELLIVEKEDKTLGGLHGVAVGSRAHLEKNSIASREWYRTVLMRGFHVFVMALCTQNVRDTQCGFKLFTAESAKLLFSNLHLYRWAFDIEIIFLAEKFHIPLTEVAVNWHEVEGSKLIKNKLDVVTTSLTMARDIICLRMSYLLGIWKVKGKDDGSKHTEL